MQNVTAAGLGIGDDYPPRIMGVLNVSRESPYDQSVYDDPSEAAEYVDSELIAEGADIVDVGLESANKRFEVLSAEEELDRLDVAVEAIESVSDDAVFSIETRYAEVADEALSQGFDMVNDVCGFADPEMPAVCRERDAAVVKMASPPDLTRPGAIETVDDIYDALKRGGLTDKTIVDPAFGGWSEDKTLDDDRETFRRLREFRGLGQPILVSINRKNFLRDLAGRSTEQALPVSLAATSMAVERGAHVVRTHDVAETADAAKIGAAFARDRVRGDVEGVGVEELDVTTTGEATRHLERLGVEEVRFDGTRPDGTRANETRGDGTRTDGTRTDETRADGTRADEAAMRVVELSGLSDVDRETLGRAAPDADVTVAPGESGVLLAGTPAGFARLQSAVAESSDRLSAALEAVGDPER